MLLKKCKKIIQKTIHLKYQLQYQMNDLNYLTDCILYQTFKIILSIPLKNMKN